MVSLLVTIVGTILFAGVLAALYIFPRTSKGPTKAGAVSTTESKHEADVEKVLSGLANSRLFIAAKKSEFVLEEAAYLGYIISAEGLFVRRLKPRAEHRQVFTASEVSKHNTASDCWIIIKNKVYNVTPYVEEHPGGYAILNHAGGDSTEGFYGPQHASRVFDMVDEFYIGDLTL